MAFAYATQNSIKGMAEFYNDLLENISDLNFVYLSSAPKRLMMKSHKKFLDSNKFPDGQLILRKSLFESSFDHKIENIEKVIEELKPKKLILIGDNGESDSEIFEFVYEKYADSIEIHQFIRRTYSAPTSDGSIEQVEFVTPVEICLSLEQAGLAVCPESYLVSVFLEVSSEIDVENFGSFYFHPYMDCYGYEWPLEDFSLPVLGIVKDLRDLLLEKCSQGFPLRQSSLK